MLPPALIITKDGFTPDSRTYKECEIDYNMKKKFLNDYKLSTVETEKGVKQNAEYVGRYYEADLPDEELHKIKAVLVTLSVLIAAVVIGMGFLNNDGNRIFYVIMPYAILFLPIAFLIISAISFYRLGRKLTRIEHHKSFERIKVCALAAMILAISAVAGDIIYIVLGQPSALITEIAYLVCSLAIAFLGFLVIQIHKKVTFRITGTKVTGQGGKEG